MNKTWLTSTQNRLDVFQNWLYLPGKGALATDLERIQKTACHIILGQSYDLYTAALELLQLETLEFQRNLISLKFSLKAEKHQKFRFWFKANEKKVNDGKGNERLLSNTNSEKRPAADKLPVLKPKKSFKSS